MALWLLSLGCRGAAAPAVHELDVVNKISRQEARKLVQETYPPGDPYRPVELDPVPNPFALELYGFKALWPNPVGSPHMCSHEVNPWTGDVWDDDHFCTLVETPALTELQREIATRLKLSEEALVKARTLKPACYKGP